MKKVSIFLKKIILQAKKADITQIAVGRKKVRWEMIG